ncbi:hypothetical protein [Nonomuraea candida]|uniref:hypothetical protein n=1 Tax=Nonomuraea candida TaxID=359159 RepID=UPI0005BCFB1A|nr:hypothetical protein [Nonomuraea candida]
MRPAVTICLLAPLALAGPAPAAAARSGPLHDFGAPGVVIWSEPRAGSGRNGLGHPGQGFVSDRSEEHGPFRCGPFDSVLWHHGTNATTGIIGWVPACALIDDD